MVVKVGYKVRDKPVNAMIIHLTFVEPHRIHIADLKRHIRLRLEDHNVLHVVHERVACMELHLRVLRELHAYTPETMLLL